MQWKPSKFYHMAGNATLTTTGTVLFDVSSETASPQGEEEVGHIVKWGHVHMRLDFKES